MPERIVSHTPGNWRVAEVIYIETDARVPVARALLPEDARLIAAAPDLLAAGKKAQRWGHWQDCMSERPNAYGNYPFACDCPMREIDAAIAKATETPE